MRQRILVILAACVLLLSACSSKLPAKTATSTPNVTSETLSSEALLEHCIRLLGTDKYDEMIEYFPKALELESFDGLVAADTIADVFPKITKEYMITGAASYDEAMQQYKDNPEVYHNTLTCYFTIDTWFAYINTGRYDDLQENFLALYMNIMPYETSILSLSVFDNELEKCSLPSNEGILKLIQLFEDHTFKKAPYIRENMNILFAIKNMLWMRASCWRYIGEEQKSIELYNESAKFQSEFLSAI